MLVTPADVQGDGGSPLYRVTCPPVPESVKTVADWIAWRPQANAQMLLESQEALYGALVARYGRDLVDREAVDAHCAEGFAEALRIAAGTMH